MRKSFFGITELAILKITTNAIPQIIVRANDAPRIVLLSNVPCMAEIAEVKKTKSEIMESSVAIKTWKFF